MTPVQSPSATTGQVAIIVASSLNKVIGKDNKLPWRLPDDFKRFKDLTMGSSVIMGRKTYESIGGPLTGRHNIILTGNKDFSARNCAVFSSLQEALASAAAYGNATGHRDIFFIGGENVYRQALPLADTIYMTLVLEHFEGDAFFPDVDRSQWEETERLFHDSDDKHPYPFIFLTYKRKTPR